MVRIIAELGLAHDGSLGQAFAMTSAAKKYGATDIKYQMHLAEAESTEKERFRIKFSPQDDTRYQ